MIKKIIFGIIIAGIFSISFIKVARAILQDTEYATGNLVKGATINLRVGDNDPATFSFIFNNVAPGEVRELVQPVASIGGVAGNFWMEIYSDNSQEGDNPESETETTGEGELDDCAEVRVEFDNSEGQTAQALDWTTVSTIPYLEQFWGNSIDAWAGVGTANMTMQLRTDACDADSMGDQFDLNLVFHLDQV